MNKINKIKLIASIAGVGTTIAGAGVIGGLKQNKNGDDSEINYMVNQLQDEYTSSYSIDEIRRNIGYSSILGDTSFLGIPNIELMGGTDIKYYIRSNISLYQKIDVHVVIKRKGEIAEKDIKVKPLFFDYAQKLNNVYTSSKFPRQIRNISKGDVITEEQLGIQLPYDDSINYTLTARENWTGGDSNISIIIRLNKFDQYHNFNINVIPRGVFNFSSDLGKITDSTSSKKLGQLISDIQVKTRGTELSYAQLGLNIPSYTDGVNSTLSLEEDWDGLSDIKVHVHLSRNEESSDKIITITPNPYAFDDVVDRLDGEMDDYNYNNGDTMESLDGTKTLFYNKHGEVKVFDVGTLKIVKSYETTLPGLDPLYPHLIMTKLSNNVFMYIGKNRRFYIVRFGDNGMEVIASNLVGYLYYDSNKHRHEARIEDITFIENNKFILWYSYNNTDENGYQINNGYAYKVIDFTNGQIPSSFSNITPYQDPNENGHVTHSYFYKGDIHKLKDNLFLSTKKVGVGYYKRRLIRVNGDIVTFGRETTTDDNTIFQLFNENHFIGVTDSKLTTGDMVISGDRVHFNHTNITNGPGYSSFIDPKEWTGGWTITNDNILVYYDYSIDIIDLRTLSIVSTRHWINKYYNYQQGRVIGNFMLLRSNNDLILVYLNPFAPSSTSNDEPSNEECFDKSIDEIYQ